MPSSSLEHFLHYWRDLKVPLSCQIWYLRFSLSYCVPEHQNHIFLWYTAIVTSL